jgi:hypothetical protein
MGDLSDRHYVDVEPHEATFIRAAIKVAWAAWAAQAGDPPSEAEKGRVMLAYGGALGTVGPAGLALLDQKLAVAENA